MNIKSNYNLIKKDIISEIKGLGNDAPIAQKRELLKDYNAICNEYVLLDESKKQSFQEIDKFLKIPRPLRKTCQASD